LGVEGGPDFEAILNEIRSSPAYRNQIVYWRRDDAREATFADTAEPLCGSCRRFLDHAGIERLYCHQAEAVDAVREGKDVLVVTGTASGKSLCYQLSLLEMLERDPAGKALLLHPTKALSQDQFQAMQRALGAAFPLHLDPLPRGERGNAGFLAGVFDGDTPANMRRKLRDEGSIILTNPDMLHAGLLPQHTRWAEFLQNLRVVVVDELHTYGGLFGSNAANLFRRFERVCQHYGSRPQYIFCSATIANPRDVALKLTGRDPVVIDRDGSPRGAKTFVFWNPPRIRQRRFRSRRSANVEATELMAELLRAGIPTITFSKAKITAELIYRYVTELLQKVAPHLAGKVTSYRGGYLPEDRRDIERRLFTGELLGVSTTPALELGIDVGGLDASIMVGYPGTLAGFFQQAGRAGRRERESLAILVGIDTSVNQYVMKHPEYLFGRPIERLVLDPDNPHVLAGQLRCAAYELPISESEVELFGHYARLVLDVLVEQKKLNKVAGKWYHASDDIPEHEVSLRDICDKNVAIIDVDTNHVIGELNKYDAQPIIHPDAIYIHQGETYIVLELDLDRMHCYVQKIDTDYYTQPLGGTDVHHIDQPLRERSFGTAKAYFGEVTSYFRNTEYEKIRFYTLDAISRHPLNMPTWQLETMAFWITPPEDLVREMIGEGLDVHRALMGVGYAVRMILPLFIQCETLDFSHSSCTAVNAPWHTVFIYERYPHGLGFTEQAFEILADVILATLERIETCDCADGCPCCVGKPLRAFSTWNIERGEASIPSKRAALRLLRGIIGDGTNLRNRDEGSLGRDEEERRLLMERGVRRRLEKMGDPEVFHPIDPNPKVGFPDVEKSARTSDADIARRALKRMRLEKRESARVDDGSLPPLHRWGPFHGPPDYLKTEPGKGVDPRDGTSTGISRSGVGPAQADAGTPDDSSRVAKDTEGTQYADLEHERAHPRDRRQERAMRNLTRTWMTHSRHESPPPVAGPPPPSAETPAISLGDSIAARARKLKKRTSQER
jgi:DEAD/DEAH box helicase domain-containing protein